MNGEIAIINREKKAFSFKMMVVVMNFSLAQSRFSTYNAKEFNLGINLTYKYTITNMGKNRWNKFINKRDLVKVELFSV